MSPIAKMCGTLVRIWMSTGMKPRSVTFTPAFSAPIFLPFGAAAHRLQHQVVELRLLEARPRLRTPPGCRRAVASAPTVLVFSMMLSKRGAFIFCQTLHQVAVGAQHQAVEHLDDVEARAERRVDRAHLEADDAAADDQHALRHRSRSSSAPVESTMRGSSGMNGSRTACEPAAMIAVLEATIFVPVLAGHRRSLDLEVMRRR